MTHHRLTTIALYEAATDGLRAPVDAECDDEGEWRVCVDCVVAEFLANATVRKSLSGAVEPEDCVELLAKACSGAYVGDVTVDGGALLGPCLVPRKAWAPADVRFGNALIAAMNHEECAEADLFEPVGWQAQKLTMNVTRRPGAAPAPGSTPWSARPSKARSRFARGAAAQHRDAADPKVWSVTSVGPPAAPSTQSTVDTSGCRGASPGRSPGTES